MAKGSVDTKKDTVSSFFLSEKEAIAGVAASRRDLSPFYAQKHNNAREKTELDVLNLVAHFSS